MRFARRTALQEQRILRSLSFMPYALRIAWCMTDESPDYELVYNIRVLHPYVHTK